MSKSLSTYSFVVLALLSIVWGSSFILIKKALIGFDPILVGALRISISSLAFTPILIYNLKKVEWRKWKLFAIVGLTGSGIPSFMYAIAQTQIDSSVSGLLNSLSPIFAMVFGVMFFGITLSLKKFVGVMLGFFGASLLLLAGQEISTSGNILYGLFIVVGTMCYGISVNVVKNYFQHSPSIVVSGLSFVMIGPPAMVYIVFSDFTDVMISNDHAWYSLGAIAILSLLGTVLSTIIFYRLVQMSNAIFASSVAFTIPIVALFWGYLDGESLTIYHFLAMATILVGVYMIRRSK